MKRSLALLLLASLPSLAARPKAIAPEQLLAETFEAPGSYNQMCMLPPGIDAALPLPLYGAIVPRHFHVSDANIARLKSRRAEVIPALVKLIASIRPDDAETKLPPAPKDPKKAVKYSDFISHSGVSPKQVSGLLLEMVEGLNAIEALPELLALEERLHAAIDRAESDERVAPPSVDPDAVLYFIGAQATLPPRQQNLAKARLMQRELLSAMLGLLRTQRFQPLLDSDFERTYAEALKKRAAEDDLREIKTPEDARKKGLLWVRFDPIYHLPLGYLKPSLPYTPEIREKARGLVASFIATVPPASWKTSPP